MSKLLTFLLLSVFVVLGAGFVYLAVIDIPIEQTAIEKETTLDAVKKEAATNS